LAKKHRRRDHHHDGLRRRAVEGRGGAEPVSLPLESACATTVRRAADIGANLFEPFVSSKHRLWPGLALVAKVIGDHGGIIDSSRIRAVRRFESCAAAPRVANVAGVE